MSSSDVDRCVELWKEYHKWKKFSEAASTLFKNYLIYAVDDSPNIHTLLKNAANFLESETAWSGDAAKAAEEKIRELYIEEQDIIRSIREIRATAKEYCDKKANDAYSGFESHRAALDEKERHALKLLFPYME